MNILQMTTGTFDISTPVKVAEYTATAPTLVMVQLSASGLHSIYSACMLRTVGDKSYQSNVVSGVVSSRGTGYLPSLVVPVNTGDNVSVWMEGQAADTAVAVRVEVWDAYAGSLVDAIENISSGIDQQGVRDAMLLAPSPGEAAAGSVDAKLDDILEGINTLRPAVLG